MPYLRITIDFHIQGDNPCNAFQLFSSSWHLVQALLLVEQQNPTGPLVAQGLELRVAQPSVP
jgi:hypothetical protein